MDIIEIFNSYEIVLFPAETLEVLKQYIDDFSEAVSKGLFVKLKQEAILSW